MCSLLHCIPHVYVCDGIVDCTDGRDEYDCHTPNSCQEWWDAGYQDSGVYNICKYDFFLLLSLESYLSLCNVKLYMINMWSIGDCKNKQISDPDRQNFCATSWRKLLGTFLYVYRFYIVNRPNHRHNIRPQPSYFWKSVL